MSFCKKLQEQCKGITLFFKVYSIRLGIIKLLIVTVSFLVGLHYL